MFEDLVNTLEAHNYGVRAYEQVAQLCYKSIAEKSDFAVHFLVLSVFAERFVSRYDEYPLTVEEANTQKKRILDWIEKLEISLQKSPEDQTKLLNRVSRDFLFL